MAGDKNLKTTNLLCGLATFLMILGVAVIPVGIYLYRTLNNLEMTTDTAIMMMGCSAGCFLISLIMSIVAKVKTRSSKRAVVCMVFSIILMVTYIMAILLASMAFSQYQRMV